MYKIKLSRKEAEKLEVVNFKDIEFDLVREVLVQIESEVRKFN